MTNYDIYVGTLERAIDTLSNLVEYPYDHRRKEVRDLHDEIRKIGMTDWLKSECKNQRWWAGVPLKERRNQKMSGQIELLKLRKESLAHEMRRVQLIIQERANSSGGDDEAEEYKKLLKMLEEEYNAL